MTAHAGMATSLPIVLNGSMSLGGASFGQYPQAPPEVDDLGFLDDWLAAELDGGGFDMGDLLLNDLQLPAAGARAASNALVPPLSPSYISGPACACDHTAICCSCLAPPTIAAPTQREVSRGPHRQLPASCEAHPEHG